MGVRRNAHSYLVARPEGKRPLGRPRPSWEDIIKIDLQKVVWGTGWMWLRIGTGCGVL
jgi:hypothetical protein